MALKMDTLFLELTVIVGYLVWSPVYGKETKCKEEFEMACVKRVICEFNEKIIDERREFMIEYKRPGQTREVIAACQWRNEQFSCDPVKGILCEAQPGNNFTVLIDTKEKCLTDGEIQFDVAHEQLIRCELSRDKSASNIKLNVTQAKGTSGSGADGNSVTVGVIAGVVICLLVTSVIAAF
ncbi:uncharacterized protein LOC112568942 [Pomacea canaliculata]|uniref:uncharacterized protein LOC112568942 n=1 Tax=Pomacea canaliculata TaxID=400727 RepID=UPI000D73E98D|nr:uncharacterized protein LOC112568942 [Pomacea canaliculata]